MTVRLCLTACLAFAVGLIAVPVTAAEPKNLLVNGSFEDGPKDIGAFTSLDKDSKAIKGWVVIGGQIDLIGTFWQAADGKRSLDLHGSPGYGGVAQTFKTEKGKKYTVTFSLAGNPIGTLAKKAVVVRAAGTKKEFTFDTTGKSNTDMGWAKETWEFTAEKAETTLEFVTAMTEDKTAGPVLDDVSVVEAKLPKSPTSGEALEQALTKLGYVGIALEREKTGHLVARVQVEGKDGLRDLRLVVDNGSSVTLLTPNSAKALGLETVRTSGTVGGVGGTGIAVATTKTRTLKVGGHADKDLSLLVIDISHVNEGFKAAGLKTLDGVLGSDWMLAKSALIDVESARLFILPSKAN